MARSPRSPPTDDQITDWLFLGVLGLVFGAPLLWLVGAALLEEPIAVVLLVSQFVAANWWYWTNRREVVRRREVGRRVRERTRPTPGGETVAPLDAGGWVDLGTTLPPVWRPRPLLATSPLPRATAVARLAEVLPPLTPGRESLRSMQVGDRWMDADEADSSTRVSLHLSGPPLARFVRASVGVDGELADRMTGCTFQGWLRPSRTWRIVSIAGTLGALGLAIRAAGDVLSGDAEEPVASVLFAGALVAFGIGSPVLHLRRTRRLVLRLGAQLSTALDAPLLMASPDERHRAPRRTRTTLEARHHEALTGVGRPVMATRRGCLPALTLVASGSLLVFGSALALL